MCGLHVGLVVRSSSCDIDVLRRVKAKDGSFAAADDTFVTTRRESRWDCSFLLTTSARAWCRAEVSRAGHPLNLACVTHGAMASKQDRVVARAARRDAVFAPDLLTAAIAPEGPVPASDAATDRHRAIFISDIHLGTRGCKASYLLDFLRHTECDTLYLVGDIIDGWAMKKGFYWPQAHNDVVQKVLRKARKGTRVDLHPRQSRRGCATVHRPGFRSGGDPTGRRSRAEGRPTVMDRPR